MLFVGAHSLAHWLGNIASRKKKKENGNNMSNSLVIHDLIINEIKIK